MPLYQTDVSTAGKMPLVFDGEKAVSSILTNLKATLCDSVTFFLSNSVMLYHSISAFLIITSALCGDEGKIGWNVDCNNYSHLH